MINGNRLKKSKIRLKSEWPLAVFTLAAAILTGVFSGSMFSALRVNPFVYFAAGFLTLLLSTAHLGRKERIFRAVLNFRNSWLSREVLFYSLFLGFSTLYFLLNSHHSYTAWIITFTGFAALFSIDKIYQVMPQTGIPNLNSSQIFLSGLFWCGIFSGNALMYSWFGIMKFVLYIFRKTNIRKKKQRTYPFISLARLTFGFIIPLVMLNMDRFEYSIETIYIIIFVFIGELIDRFEFYNELEIITPEKQIEIDMVKMQRRRNEEIEFANRRSRSSLSKRS